MATKTKTSVKPVVLDQQETTPEQFPASNYLQRLQERKSALLQHNDDFIRDLKRTAPVTMLRMCAAGLLCVTFLNPAMALPVLCVMVSMGVLAKPIINLGIYFLVACSLRAD